MRKIAVVFLVCLLFSSTAALAADGLISVKSTFPVKKTADRLQSALQQKGMTVFARIDHSAAAAKVGKNLRPTELIIFGNPKIGSSLMICAQTTAIDLPQKALIWKDAGGQVWLSYNDPQYLARRHGIGTCGKAVLAKIAKALANFAHSATAP